MRADSVFPDKDIVELQFEIEWAEGITRIGWGKIGGDTVESVAPVLGLPFASRCGTACGVQSKQYKNARTYPNLESHGHADL